MALVLKIFGALGLFGALAIVWQARSALGETTLKLACRWSTAGLTLWITVWLLTIGGPVVSDPVSDQLWYAADVVMLCPLVAVLGARWPGLRFWSWFVLVPLVLVLELPALSAWTGFVPIARLQLDAAVVVGWLLVLVMGVGNYFGTRFTAAAIIVAAGMILVLSPVTSFVSEAHANTVRVWGTGYLCVALYWARWVVQAHPASEPGLDRLWSDFRDWFGIVWAKRVLDRLNQAAQNEHLGVRLELYGLTPIAAGDTVSAADAKRVEHTLRWLLRRFVEAAWIDKRLGFVAESGREIEESSPKCE